MLEGLSRDYPNRKAVMFLGSNLGNFNYDQSIAFLRQLNTAMGADDLLFIGLDLKKDPEVIRKAYNDPHGYTRDFNLNLLRRMNRELGADFNPDYFSHEPYYDSGTGAAKSYLVSTREQDVCFSRIDETISFHKWESIYTERSQKYDMEMIHGMAVSSDTQTVCHWKGTASYFSIEVEGQVNQDAAWYYPYPSNLAEGIKEHVAFWRGVEVTK